MSLTTENSTPVRYVLYSHYPEGDDLKHYDEGRVGPDRLEGVQYLVKHFKGLRGMLTWPGYEGLLVLFYAPGLAKCLTGIGRGKSLNELVRDHVELRFASEVDKYIQEVMRKEFKEEEGVPRLRFITALDLHKVFGRLTNSKVARSLRSWIVGAAGDAEGGKYDSPKIVEAIVRLRLLGAGVPVFRVDHDVLFRGEENWEKKNLEFSSTIGSCLTAYQLKRDTTKLSSFMFSASYDHQALLDPKEANKFRTWSRAFATRVYPALPIKKELMDTTLESIRQNAPVDEAWDSYAKESFNQSLARKFFGLDSDDIKTSEVRGIGKIGAHPLTSVISGAMLYLSEGAILDLPPFSNFGLNVSWIDDHLKYCLHRELRHLSPITLRVGSERRPKNLMTFSKIDNVIVQKTGRKPREDLRKYIFDEYLPILLRGTIMDAWITHEPLLKYRPENLSDRDGEAWHEIPREKQSRAVLPSALQRALEECDFGPDEERDLRPKLFDSALKRINEVRSQWRELTEDGLETFASIWAKGEAKSRFPDLNLKYSGIANPAVVKVDVDIPAETALDGLLQRDLSTLVEDAMGYIEWTLNWPKFVQVVRSIEQRTLRSDLNFDPEREDKT